MGAKRRTADGSADKARATAEPIAKRESIVLSMNKCSGMRKATSISHSDLLQKMSSCKHPAEDPQSWELFQERSSRGRTLKKIPKPEEDTEHAIMIDAGSQGTRLHLYEFRPRILKHRHEIEHVVQGRKLSFPTTNSRWSSRLKPGLDSFAYENLDNMKRQLEQYLGPLLQFAKQTLSDKEKHWYHYPVYLKATGGLRALPRPYRLELVKQVRELFYNKTFNPFFFEEEHARVISGEEEAIYGWVATNFVTGTLIKNSEGTGTVLTPNSTFGMLEMGGASTQIAFFETYEDVMANLFKLQLGASRHWNIYCHSFLYFGVNGAYARLNARLVMEAEAKGVPGASEHYNPCLPGGSQYVFSSRVKVEPDQTLLPFSSENDSSVLEADLYSAIMRNNEPTGDFDQCYDLVYKLFRKEANAWCNFAHDRDCSFAGIYQPPLPWDTLEFIVTSNFQEVIQFLGIGVKANLADVRAQAQRVCGFSKAELVRYNSELSGSWSDDDLLQACFRAVFVVSLEYQD